MSASDKLSPHFTKRELGCRCGCGTMPKPALVDALEMLRKHVGKPLRITSGARCAVHNAKVGGAKQSLHVTGVAADIACLTGEMRYDLILGAALFGFHGVGVADSFVHIDLREKPSLWMYAAGHGSRG